MHTKNHMIHSGLSGELRYRTATTKLIIICHGFQSSSSHPALVAIAQGLNAKGYATFTFNFSGGNPMDLARQTADISDILAHFAKDHTDMILLAGSFGALSAAIAARRSGLTGLITINGFFGTAQLGRKYKPTFLASKMLALVNPRYGAIWDFYKREYQPERITVPVLVMHSVADSDVSVAQSRGFLARLRGPKQFVDLAPADHHLSSHAYTDRVVGEVDKWLRPL